MRRRNRIPFATGIWCSLFAIATGVMAWKFGWLPIEVVSPETGRLHEQSGDTGDGPSPPDDRPIRTEIQADPIVFTAQAEPEFEDEPAFADRRTAGGESGAGWREPPRTVSARQWDDPPAPTIPVPPLSEFAEFALPSQAEPPVVVDEESEPAPPPLDTFSGSPREFRRLSVEDEPPQVPAAARSPIVQISHEIESPDFSSEPDDPRLQEIEKLLKAGETLAAHKELSKLYWKEPDLRPVLQKRIDTTARTIYFSPQPHFMDPYVIQPGDQLRKVARQYEVSWQYLATLNQVDPPRIRAGQRLKVIKGPFAAVVELGRFELIVHAHGYYVRRYQVGIGKDGSSPIGRHTVLDKVVDPQYTDPDGRVFKADHPDNPLGGRWINLGNSYGIHGTLQPGSIGKAESRGCIRLLNAEVEELYDLLEIGSEVIIRP